MNGKLAKMIRKKVFGDQKDVPETRSYKQMSPKNPTIVSDGKRRMYRLAKQEVLRAKRTKVIS